METTESNSKFPEGKDLKKGMRKRNFFEPTIRRGKKREIKKTVGIQPELLGKDGEPVDVEGGKPLSGKIIPTINSKPLKGIERESAEIQILGEAGEDTLAKARAQRYAIIKSIKSRKKRDI